MMTTLAQWLVYPIIRKYLFIEPYIGNPRIWEIQEIDQDVVFIEEDD
jgi:hypothetical protein